jgi:hypothetical protein
MKREWPRGAWLVGGHALAKARSCKRVGGRRSPASQPGRRDPWCLSLTPSAPCRRARSDCTEPGVVPAARLLSEFGWQSDAPWFSIKHVTPSEDWDTWCVAAGAGCSCRSLSARISRAALRQPSASSEPATGPHPAPNPACRPVSRKRRPSLVCRALSAQYRQRWNTQGNRIKTQQMGRYFGGLPAHDFSAADPQSKAQLYGDWIYLRQVRVRACVCTRVCLCAAHAASVMGVSAWVCYGRRVVQDCRLEVQGCAAGTQAGPHCRAAPKQRSSPALLDRTLSQPQQAARNIA